MVRGFSNRGQQFWTTCCCLVAVFSWIRSASCDLTLTEQDEVVDLHNTLRRGEGSSNMQLMKWNPTLAIIAQNWSANCVWAHGQGVNSSSLSSIGLGQNNYASYPAPPVNLAAGVQKWFDEKADYTYDSNSCATGKVCGHYTQVVWATTNQIGCGYTICPILYRPTSTSNFTDAIFLVCNYAPPGNWVGQSPFMQGSSCSQCSSDQPFCNNGLCDSAGSVDPSATGTDYPTTNGMQPNGNVTLEPGITGTRVFGPTSSSSLISNIALNKPARLGKTFGGDIQGRLAKYAVDGITSTSNLSVCAEGDDPNNNNWLQVNLINQYAIDSITLYVPDMSGVNNTVVYVGDSPTGFTYHHVCVSLDDNPGIPTGVDGHKFYCNSSSSIVGSYITIRKTTVGDFLTVCEFVVSGYLVSESTGSYSPPSGTTAMPTPRPRDCYALKQLGVTLSGVYQVWLSGPQRWVNVYCDMVTDGGGWTVFQRRLRGCQDFNYSWTSYASGFGQLELEFWLGNEIVFSMLDAMKTYSLRVDLTDFDGNFRYAVYNKFRIASALDMYRLLSLGNYYGTAGDAMSVSVGFRFSTFDSDNDVCPDTNSAVRFHGAWWYVSADFTYANLNGFYHGGRYTSSTNDGVIWIPFKGASYSLKTTEMKFRPNSA